MELGIGIGWRPEIADTVERLPELDWVEVVAENVCPGHLPPALLRLRSRGVRVVPHGVSLGLGGADRPSKRRLADLAERAEALAAPLVTEHIAFVRAGGALTASAVQEAGHLLPVPRTWDALAVLCENVRIAQDSLPVPLALENIAAMFSWPGEELTEGQFLAELVERTGVRLLIDVANLHTNHVNRGEDPSAALDELPVESIAYVHVAGGVERDGIWHDTHAHPVTRPVLDILSDLRSRVNPPGVLLERDDDFPAGSELEAELATIRTTLASAAHSARSASPRTTPSRQRRPAPPPTQERRPPASTSRSGRPPCCPRSSRERPHPRDSTHAACACRAAPSPPSARTSSRRSRPSCPRSSGPATGPPSSRTPGTAPCTRVTGATRSTSPSTCWPPDARRTAPPGAG